MSKLAISPAVAVPSTQGSDKILQTGTNNPAAGVKDSDFSKKLTKVMHSYSGPMRKKLTSTKENSLPYSYNQINSLQDLGQDSKDIQPLKPESSKSIKAADKRQSDSTQARQSKDQDSAPLKDDSEAIAASDEKTSTTKNKQNSNELIATAVSPLLSATPTQGIEGIQMDQHNAIEEHSGIDGVVSLDKLTANMAAASANAADKGNSAQTQEANANTVDPIHDLSGGATFLKQLMSADDTKVLSAASMGNASELSILQNNVFQSGAGISGNNPRTQQSTTVNSSTAAQNQNLASQQVALAGNELLNQPAAEGQNKTKNADNLKTSGASNGKSAEVQTPLTGLKASDGASPVTTLSKDGNGMVPLKLNSDTFESGLTEKGSKISDSSAVGQGTAKNGKSQSINLPVIQTQLSVNNQNDKNRTDNSMAIAAEQPHTTDVTAKVSANASPAEPVNKDDLFAQIVKKAKVSLNHGNGEMEVNLKPDHLGKLHLKVSVENQLVTAKFVAESQQVKEIIETNLNQLRRDLQDNGIQVDQLMVSVGGHHNDGGFQNASHNSSGFTGQQNNSRAASQEMPFKSAENQVQSRNSHSQTAIDLIA